MKSRYFSIENKIQETTTETQISNETSEKISESFKERRDYLIKKLLQSRTLPEPATDSTQKSTQIAPTTSDSPNEKKTNQPEDNIAKASRKHSFQDEYIPLFNVDKTEPQLESDNESVVLDEPDSPKRKVYNPKLNTIENYKGPYSMKCLMRTRQYLIDCFKPYSTTYSRSNFEDRLFEIVKLKLNIKSKFDDDKKLLKKIRRETALEKEIIYERIESQNRRTKSFQTSTKQKNKHARFVEDSDSDDCIIENEPKKRKKTVVTIDLEHSDKEEEEEEESDLIQLIANQETFEKLDYEDDIDDEDFSYDEDSKCIQFGNYSKKKQKSTKKKVKSSTSSLRREEKETKTTNETQSNTYRLNRVGLAATSSHYLEEETNNQLIELESKYKKLRNQRNKLLRKKKGIEINSQRELMSSELKKIRSIMKKIRRKKHPKHTFDFKTSVNKSKLKKKKKNKTKI